MQAGVFGKKEVRIGKETKIPISPRTDSYAPANKADTFSNFEEAVEKIKGYKGLGIRVDGNLFVINLDDCAVHGNLNNTRLEIVEHSPQSYIEYTPRGKGLRIFTFLAANLIYNNALYKMKTKDVEVYAGGFTNRFLTVTGNVYQKGGIVEEVLLWILEKCLKRNEEKSFNIKKFKSYLTDEKIIEKASSASNKDKFLSLWNGDTTGYPSKSEGDLDFTSILAFYSSGDQDQIDSLFRRLGLFRDKWDEKRGVKTYRELTIDQAIRFS